MDDKGSWGQFFLDLALDTVNFLLSAVTVMKLWEWFVAPLGIPELGLLQAAGLHTLVTFMTYGQIVDDDMDGTVRTGVRILFAIGTLFLGFIIHAMV